MTRHIQAFLHDFGQAIPAKGQWHDYNRWKPHKKWKDGGKDKETYDPVIMDD